MSQVAQVFRLVLVASFVATPWAPSPAAANADGNRDFEIAQSSVQPNSASSGSKITVSMTAENVGSESRTVLLRFEIVPPGERIQKAAERQRTIESGDDYPQIWTYSGTSAKGTYTVYLSVFDANTYHRYDQVQHTFNITEFDKRPSCERSNPADGMITRISGQPFTLEVRCTDEDGNLAGGQWQVDDQDLQQESSAGASNTESHTFTLTAGSYWIDYYAWDGKGAESLSVGWSVKVEESGGSGGTSDQPPTCSRQYPISWENTAEPGESFALTAACSDPDGDLDYGDWRLGDSFVETMQLGSSATATRSFSLDGEGTYVIHFIPHDKAGTYGEAASWQFTVGGPETNKPPVIIKREPSWDGSVDFGTLVRFYVEVEDKDEWSIIKRTWVMERPDGNRETYPWTSSYGGYGRTWTYWNVTLSDYGTWGFRLIWEDSGALSSSSEWTFTVKGSEPSPTAAPPPYTTAPAQTSPAMPQPQGKGVVLVHGICSDAGKWLGESGMELHRRLREGGIPTERIYAPEIDPTRFETPQEMVNELANQIKTILYEKPDPPQSLVIVGHSNGGLIARGLLRTQIDQTRIERIITVDSPDRGRDLANNANWLFELMGATENCPYDDAWEEYASNFLTVEGTGEMYPSILNNDSLGDPRIVRILFASCTALTCNDGNSIVNRNAADWRGAFLIAAQPERLAPSGGHKQALRLCKESGSLESTAIIEFSDEVIQRPGKHLLHVWGTAYYADVISNLALGLAPSDDSIGLAPYVLSCHEASQVEIEKTESIAAKVAFSPASPQGTLISADSESSVVTSREGPYYRVQVHVEPGTGRHVIMDVEKPDPMPLDGRRLQVYLDGMSVKPAGSYDEFRTAEQSPEPIYLLTLGARRAQVAIWVPSFSTRTIVVELPENQPASDFGFPDRHERALGDGFEDAVRGAYVVLAQTPPVFGVNPWLLVLVAAGLIILIGQAKTKKTLRRLEQGLADLRHEIQGLRQAPAEEHNARKSRKAKRHRRGQMSDKLRERKARQSSDQSGPEEREGSTSEASKAAS